MPGALYASEPPAHLLGLLLDKGTCFWPSSWNRALLTLTTLARGAPARAGTKDTVEPLLATVICWPLFRVDSFWPAQRPEEWEAG